jgi:hypothetical protein
MIKAIPALVVRRARGQLSLVLILVRVVGGGKIQNPVNVAYSRAHASFPLSL